MAVDAIRLSFQHKVNRFVCGTYKKDLQSYFGEFFTEVGCSTSIQTGLPVKIYMTGKNVEKWKWFFLGIKRSRNKT